jgi:hypothetical protein
VGEKYKDYQLKKSDLAPVSSAIKWRCFTFESVTEEVYARSALPSVRGQEIRKDFLRPILEKQRMSRPTDDELLKWWFDPNGWSTPFPVAVEVEV